MNKESYYTKEETSLWYLNVLKQPVDTNQKDPMNKQPYTTEVKQDKFQKDPINKQPYTPEVEPTKPLDIQVGGQHYKTMNIQPIEFIHANQIPFCEANAIKYLCRWRTKNGIQDLEKAKHYIDLLIQMEQKPK